MARKSPLAWSGLTIRTSTKAPSTADDVLSVTTALAPLAKRA